MGLERFLLKYMAESLFFFLHYVFVSYIFHFDLPLKFCILIVGSFSVKLVPIVYSKQ